jgi:hypothetical protein
VAAEHLPRTDAAVGIEHLPRIEAAVGTEHLPRIEATGAAEHLPRTEAARRQFLRLKLRRVIQPSVGWHEEKLTHAARHASPVGTN